MTIKTIDSNRARALWREILDAAQAGNQDLIVERYGKPVAAVIAYEDFLALQDALDDVRAARRAAAALEEWQREPGRTVPYESNRAGLVAEGLLDE